MLHFSFLVATSSNFQRGLARKHISPWKKCVSGLGERSCHSSWQFEQMLPKVTHLLLSVAPLKIFGVLEQLSLC